MMTDKQLYLKSIPFDSKSVRSESEDVKDLIVQTFRRASEDLATIHRPSSAFIAQKNFIMELFTSHNGSSRSLDSPSSILKDKHLENIFKEKSRKVGKDSLFLMLSVLYAKLIFVLGIAFPVTDILSTRADVSKSFYQGFYLYLYVGSLTFLIFVFATHLKNRNLFSIIDTYEEKSNNFGTTNEKKRVIRYGSFYLRVGAIAFGIGSMVYLGLEFGQYFEMKAEDHCQNALLALNPAVQMILTIFQMQFIFLNTKELHMTRYKNLSRFGLMHMIATNLCEWIYVLVEETKHEIDHLNFVHNIHKRATSLTVVIECRRESIMGRLVQNVSPFLFPCTIEYSLICAVILYEMWKKIQINHNHFLKRQDSLMGHHTHRNVHYLSVDCSRAHRGLFAGIVCIVMIIISLIMFFVLDNENKLKSTAIIEITYSEIALYVITAIAVIIAMMKMQNLQFLKPSQSGIGLDCTLLLLAQSGVYIYSMFSILGCFLTRHQYNYSFLGLISEVFSIIQTSLQTIFILDAWWRRIKGQEQNRKKPGREIITFLLIANMAIWFINCLIKNRASFRVSHLEFFGVGAWTIITHTSMPLAIFYRFHSTICLFEIWKMSYKLKNEEDEH
ncbi:CLUMA_CG006295, isoform A [Clunio marinus]|uniref:CLUMA_CG006295, isoform A n=1 Tax=Clunio marinus TaxID=568069 RepID=A0A1J1HXL1_9DIPT|nr:CLUMA_CG006295, isoform A [Clunio marinus]